jgi:RecA/RadA recombinase
MPKKKEVNTKTNLHPMFAVKLGGMELQRTVPVAETNLVKTRDPNFNKILGGGIPTMGITEFWGESGGGKSTAGIEATRAFLGNIDDSRGCAWFDVEYSGSTIWMNKCGIDYDLDGKGQIQYQDVKFPDGRVVRMPLLDPNLGIMRPPAGMSGNKIFTAIRDLVRSNTVKLIVLDSLAALVPEQDILGAENSKNDDLAKTVVGSFARMVGNCLKQLRPYLIEYQVQLIFINQLRTKLTNYGGMDVSPGGRAAEHYRDISIQFVKMGASEKYNADFVECQSGEEATGFKSKLISKRSKVADNILSSIEVGINYTSGIDHLYNTISYAKAEGYLFTTGSSCRIKLFTPDAETGKMYMKFKNKVERMQFIQDNPEWWADYCEQMGTAELEEYEVEDTPEWEGVEDTDEEIAFSQAADGSDEELKEDRASAELDELK